MFTGIIEEVGFIQSIEWHAQGARFHIQASTVLEDVKIGDSLSLNGCCLTLVKHQSKIWTCDVTQETLSRTTLKNLQAGDRVNLERAIRYHDRLGGHLVQGHVDEVGEIIHKESLSDDSWWMTIAASPAILRYMITKGSIAVDGISLTIADLQKTSFSLAIIPHTSQVTTLGFKQMGDTVNLEIDLMAKYVERLIHPLVSISSTGNFSL